MFTSTINEGANRKLTTSMSRKCLLRGIYTKDNYLCQKLGVKKGEHVCLKGVYFQEVTVSAFLLIINSRRAPSSLSASLI